MEIKRILWPTDLSEQAAQALPYVTSLAEKYGAEVVVLHVQEEISRFEHLADALSVDDAKRLSDRIMANTKQVFAKVCDMLGQKCSLFERRVLVGDAAQEIINCIANDKIDLVVMGTHGYGGLKRFAYGSVAEKVVHTSPVPVLTVRCK